MQYCLQICLKHVVLTFIPFSIYQYWNLRVSNLSMQIFCCCNISAWNGNSISASKFFYLPICLIQKHNKFDQYPYSNVWCHISQQLLTFSLLVVMGEWAMPWLAQNQLSGPKNRFNLPSKLDFWSKIFWIIAWVCNIINRQ